MNITDYIIDNAKDETDAMKQISDRAAKEHGNELIDFIINNDEFTADEAKERIIKLSQTKKQTKEEQPLIDVPGLRDISTPSQWYAGIKNLGYGPAKAMAHLTTPITEAARAIPKYIAENVGENTSQTPAIDTGAEFRDPIGLPSSHAGAGLFMQDVNNAFGIKNQPLAKVSSKDYPRAAEFLQNMTQPSNLAAVPADIYLAGKIPSPSIPKLPAISLETAADYVRSITKDNSLLKDLEKSGKIYDVARLVQAEPEKYLHQFRPNKVYENIMGKVNPPEGSRLIGTGELPRMNNLQNDFIETIPQSKYSLPAEELQKSAINILNSKGGIEAGQRSSAQKFIEKNIPIMQPKADKLSKIRSVESAQGEVSNLNREIPAERLQLENQLQNRKENLMKVVSEQPDLINNPNFREELQWLSDLEVADPSQSNVFPQRSREIGFKDSTGLMSTKREIPVRSSDELASSLSNKNIYDILNGEQNNPRQIPNLEKSQMLGSAIEEAQRLSSEIRELSNNPVSTVNNKNLIAKIDRKNQLNGFISENFDPTMPNAEAYMDYIRGINEKPIGYASEVRRLGNKMMEPPVLGEVSTDIGAKGLAGRAMEEAGRREQNQAIGFMDSGDKAIYDSQNSKISNLINLRNLSEGGLAGAGGRTPYVPGSAGGTTGWVGSGAKAWDRYIKPTGQELMSGAANAVSQRDMLRSKIMSSATNVMNEFSQKSQINNYKIPMTSEGVASNSDMVYYKVLAAFGKKEAEMIKSTRNADELRSVIRFLHQLNPSAFEQTKYNNFDGYIDPAFKAAAIKDITLDTVLPAHESADKMQLLLHEGKIMP